MSNPRSANIRASASRTPSTNPGPDTVLKKKYGPLPGRPNDRHSGLSPILPFISSAGVARSDAQALRREQKQMSMFYNFTAKELLDLDANITSTRSLKPSDLNFPVHPCFRKSHWFRKGPRHEPHSLGNLGSGGLWLVSEDCVWDILQPSLRLASLCLNNIQPEFFDTLLYGPRTPIDPDRFPEDPPEWVPQGWKHMLFSFKSRGLDSQDPALEQSKHTLLSALSHHARFKFKDRDETASYNGCTRCGLTQDANGERVLKVLISLDHKNYEPLLRPNITMSERLGYQWRAAVTITHECVHAIGKLAEWIIHKENNTLATWTLGPEAYFEDHSIQECGYLMEQFALGGVTRGERNPKGSLFPTIAFFWTEWPTKYWVNYRTNVILKDPLLNPRYHFYPIPVMHFEDVHQMSFWNHTVKSFGSSILGLRSLKVRMQVTDLPLFPTGSRVELDTGQFARSRWQNTHAILKTKQDMSANERRVCNAGDRIIERARLNQEFFVNSAKQNEQLKCILDYNDDLKDRRQAAAAATVPGSQTTVVDPQIAIEASMQNQYNMLLSITHAHSAAVNSYLELSNSGRTPVEIKGNLMMFNQGFRGFARQIAHGSWTEEFIQDYEYIDEILEFKRQMLYSPNDVNSRKFKHEYQEFEDLESIIDAYSKIDTEPEQSEANIFKIVERFDKRWESSRYGRVCARIINLATKIVIGETRDQLGAIKEIDAKIQALISLKNGEDDKPCDSWRKTLDNMIGRMQNIVDDLKKKVMVPGTEGAEDTEMGDYDPMAEDGIIRNDFGV